jgi:diguanylate cyclase (GGDEF)-like protein
MANKKIEFKDFFNAGDILAILVIVAGVLLAIFIDDIAIKMIGISVALLGAIALFMLISQRLTDIVDSKAINKKNKKEYEVTTTYNTSGVRKTVENFDFSLSEDELYSKKSEIKEIKIDNDKDLSLKENFNNKETENKIDENSINNKNTTSNTIFNDNYSSVRIIGTYKQTKNINQKEDEAKEIDNIKIENKNNDKNIDEIQIEPIIQNKIEEKEQEKIAKNDFPKHYFFEKDILIGEEPKTEFDYFISRILLILKSLTDTRSAFLLLVDNKKENFTIESYSSDIQLNFSSKKIYPIANDIISQIIINSKPEILTELNPLSIKDLIPYYTNEVNVKSFIGIPVIWNDNVIAVLTADSEVEDAYDSASVSLMGQFTKLISGLIKSYTHKIDLIEAAKTLEIISKFQIIELSNKFSAEYLYENVCKNLLTIFDGFTNGICVYDYDNDKWNINYLVSKNEVQKNIPFNLVNSLLGKTIINGETIYKSGLDLVNILRTHSDEEKFKSGEFLSVPIRTQSGVYGALFIESTPYEKLTNFDISILEILANHLGATIERINLIRLYQTSSIKDKGTGLFNSNAFFERLEEELERYNENQDKNLSLLLFRIDKYSSIDPELHSERLELAKNSVLHISKKYFKKYEPVGRIDAETYGALLINKDFTNAKLIGERFRNEVANTMIEYENVKFNVTISVGISHIAKGMSLNTFVSNSINALSKAMEVNNYVQVYN